MFERLAVRANLGFWPADFVESGFDGVVQAYEAAAALHLGSQLCEVGKGRVSCATVGINDDGVGFFEDGLFGPLAVEDKLDIDFIRGVFLQTFGEKLDSSIVFVLARSVAGFSSNQEDLTFGVGGVGEGAKEREREGSAECVRFEHG